MSFSPIAALLQTLQEAEQFAAGFEDDQAQQPPVTTLLANLRAQIAVIQVALQAEAANRATVAANAVIGIAESTDGPAKAAARKAIHHLLQRIQRDPRLAWHFDPITQSMEELTAAHALMFGLDLSAFQKEFFASLEFESPSCGCEVSA
ncbi:hypothetical protein [Acidovorax sp. SUPP2825]|uniref:hypothetical protein n=1 Tax=Acidovorax sp. SUPP2825 TaxID=2920879 RepID=UPI0023DE3F02|nr:hypothetical protein [Acidovorax sp. SUPP2825]GKS96925.1 hypothetical protein AVAK2825_20340 [Acidovorax sp. SUPP2825]